MVGAIILHGPHQVAKKSMTATPSPLVMALSYSDFLESVLTPEFFLGGVVVVAEAEAEVEAARAFCSRNFSWWNLTYSERLWTPDILGVAL